MNEFFQWVMLHNRPWDTHPPLSDAETEELFSLMADPSLDDAARAAVEQPATPP